MALPAGIVTRLTKFFNSYQKKANFLKTLSRKQVDEVILLVCCYIDQLGGSLFPQTGSSKRSFEQMLLTHSGERDEFSLISVADLAADIVAMAETTFLIVSKPGRLELRSDNDKPLLRFIEQTGVSLTKKSIQNLLNSVYHGLKSNFRIHSKQTNRKMSFGEDDIVISSITKVGVKGAEIREDNVRTLLREYKYTSILYREYRSKAVHEAKRIYVDSRKFWKMKQPYFIEVSSDMFTRTALKLKFPAPFLIDCLETCIECTKRAIIGKGLLPPPIWNSICNMDELDFLDVEDVEESRPIKLKIE